MVRRGKIIVHIGNVRYCLGGRVHEPLGTAVEIEKGNKVTSGR